MPTVDDKRVLGNRAEALVSWLLSSSCLVRPVASGTDVGVDLFCETVVDQKPFLHFWFQVKSGKAVRVARDQKSAKISLTVDHLEYWDRQPVPVFVALVPLTNPIKIQPDRIFVANISDFVESTDLANRKSITVRSEHIWPLSEPGTVDAFVKNVVPIEYAKRMLRSGVVGQIPTPSSTYFKQSPEGRISKYIDVVCRQVRRTAALSILQLFNQGLMHEYARQHQQLAAAVLQFGDVSHWENPFAIAVSFHADERFKEAIEQYDLAINCIDRDPHTTGLLDWDVRKDSLERLRGRAQEGKPLYQTHDEGDHGRIDG